MQAYLNFIDSLVELVNSSAKEKQQHTAINICRNLYPFYKKSVKNNTSISLLSNAIDFCEQEFSKSTVNIPRVDELIADVEKLMPSTADIQTWDEGYIINAVSAVLELLMFTKDSNNQHVVEICSIMIDNVDFELSEANDDITDDQIYEHPRMLNVMEQINGMLK